MKRIFSYVLVLVAVLIADACGPGPLRFPNADNRDMAVLFGSIEAPGKATNVNLQHYEGSSPVVGSHVYKNGLWFVENLKPGRYFLVNFKADGYVHYVDADGTNSFPRRLFSVNAGEIRFAGSYKVVYNQQKGGLERITFNYIPVSSPSEQQLLQQLIEILKDTPWEIKVRKRLDELDKNEAGRQ